MPGDGWEWPVLLLILAQNPDDIAGERDAALDWIDLYIAWRTDRLDELVEYRKHLGWVTAYMRSLLDNGKDPS